MEIHHYPVMHKEILEYLIPKTDTPVLIDCTTGEGGHTSLFLEKYPNIVVYGLDRDKEIQKKAIERLKEYGERFKPVLCWFNEYLKTRESESADLILFDLGISIFHYVESSRGFSFRNDEELDMRLNSEQELSAKVVVNEYNEEELSNIIYQYGEERYSRRISRAIVDERRKGEITSAKALSELIYHSVPPKYRYLRIHPATRTFQALRIEVNKELDRIEPSLEEAIRVLKPNGRLAVITFHSLEDRLVKWFFKKRDDITILTKKPIVASAEENEVNPPSRSAKLRIIEKGRAYGK